MKFNMRESQILELLQRGLTNKEIGRQLSISPSTVRDYISGMLRVHEVGNRVALAALHMGMAAAQQGNPAYIEKRASSGDRRATLLVAKTDSRTRPEHKDEPFGRSPA